MQLTFEERYDDSGNLLVADETRGVYLECTYEEDIATAAAQTRCALEFYAGRKPGQALACGQAQLFIDAASQNERLL